MDCERLLCFKMAATSFMTLRSQDIAKTRGPSKGSDKYSIISMSKAV
jgi:hypothetical protein